MSVPPEVFTAEPPVISVNLNAEGALPDARERVALRWKNLRRRLVDDGAPEGAVDAVEPLVDDAHAAGETLVAFANAHGLLYSAHLPELPDDDLATIGPLPHLVPFLARALRRCSRTSWS